MRPELQAGIFWLVVLLSHAVVTAGFVGKTRLRVSYLQHGRLKVVSRGMRQVEVPNRRGLCG